MYCVVCGCKLQHVLGQEYVCLTCDKEQKIFMRRVGKNVTYTVKFTDTLKDKHVQTNEYYV